MILGPYRNPPYRLPTPKTSLSPPPHGNNHVRNPSPKRKLSDESLEAAQSLQIDTTRPSTGSPMPDSPRSKVAERLKDLAIRQSQPTSQSQLHDVPSNSQSPRKKLKRNPQMRDLRGDIQSQQLSGQVQTPQHTRCLEIPDSVSDNTTLLLDVDEGSDAYAQLPPTPLPREDGINDLDEAIDIVMSNPQPHKSSPRNKRLLSPPPPSPLGQKPSADRDANPFLNKSPNSSFSDDSLSDTTAPTWQDSEITGHEITSPDDDGEGINGIGFRPTPAIAYARSQKRRQQVEGWKAREAREARQRRMDRRRRPSRGRDVSARFDGASDDPSRQEGNGRRVVHFAT
ncbi:hypothetical protein Slin15195_G127020 [Septoria linicola]|uniref:Uncharacterized protein n=1 Tax=Septoria linicola TaxID=215465 RepID=A0A9Q9B8K9_9PEZI|nr:hypothetical protein Slin15195_G127020 [Septoria linicola]